MDISTLSGLVLNLSSDPSSKKYSGAVDRISSFFQGNPLEKISKKLTDRPDQIVYDRLISNASYMFLSDNPNDYIAAMCGIVQESIRSEVDTIVSEIESISNTLSNYVSNMIVQVEHLHEVRTFPNLIRILMNMQQDMAQVLKETAYLQGRILNEGHFSKSRIDKVEQKIHDVLSNNAKIRRALGIYDPDATLDYDIKAFAKYLERRVKNLIERVKNLGDFKDRFQAEVNPVDILYKNFSRLYQYVCDATKRVTENASKWKSSNVRTLRENTEIIDEDLYRALVIFDRYRYSNMMKETEEEHSGTVIGRLLDSLTRRIKEIDMAPLLAVLNELLAAIGALSYESLKLFETPFLSFRNELVARGVPENIMALLNSDEIRNFKWSKLKNLDKYFHMNLKDIALDKLIQYGEAVNIPMDKLPKVARLLEIKDKIVGKANNLKEALNNMKNYIDGDNPNDLKSAIPEEVMNKVTEVMALSSGVNSAILNANAKAFSNALQSPDNVTKSGEMAAKLKKEVESLSSDEDSSVTLMELNACNLVLSIFSGDHEQQCKNALIRSEGNSSDGMVFSLHTDEYWTEKYDNASQALDYLYQLSAVEDTSGKKDTSSVTVEDFNNRRAVITSKGANNGS